MKDDSSLMQKLLDTQQVSIERGEKIFQLRNELEEVATERNMLRKQLTDVCERFVNLDHHTYMRGYSYDSTCELFEICKRILGEKNAG